ncbi:ras association domain-containing protein 10 [Drosophila eugracilis]|uniref:ras association domain-containing protein 10 n=1 Tax=Drosophila eugracilis TaxID=29029 RepID=UPI0007E69C0C|nr:ras association domain-containing protein 10 [Drosophila eugracilis]XP_017066399.1 ras association domain-containing protein 10 [Drosophila eugracilis]
MNSETVVNSFLPQNLAVPRDEDLGSLSSLSDNLTIWVNGEEHWISGVDASTTCADLICALISYQYVQHDKFRKDEEFADPTKYPAQVAQEFAIVQKQRHYEEYLDGCARLFDVITTHNTMPKDECQLQLRHLATSALKHTQTTDKDSGMGSPVDSSRSMRFRRMGKHKHKVVPSTKISDFTNTKQAKRSRKVEHRSITTPNESLLTIILAQDETILKQMSMLHEKDRQILQIEEERHRGRVRELGKNYLLETYLKDLDEPQESETSLEVFEDGVHRLHEEDRDFRTFIDGDTVKNEMRLYWLEKIHVVNKQLQREEELLLSLHAKVRRHQVKRAYQTKSEVLLQIDKLDTELAAQVADIHRVERKLFTANEQLKAKLAVLECLGREFETTISGATTADVQSKESGEGQQCHRSPHRPNDLATSGKCPQIVEVGSVRGQPNREQTDSNLRERQINDKALSEEMFKVIRSSDPSTSASVFQIETGPRGPFAQPSNTDIQHLGTLV